MNSDSPYLWRQGRKSELRHALVGRHRCAAYIPHSALHTPPSRRGLTLIELLIVSVILVTLVATALPVLTPSTTERRLREATRGLNTYITKVQAQAIGSGRPVGIALKRLSSETDNADARGVCLEVFTVEQPAPYAGFDQNSAVRVALNGSASDPVINGYSWPTVIIDFVNRGANNNNDGLSAGWDADLFPPGLIRPGDVIEVQGNRYELLALTTANNLQNGYYTEENHRLTNATPTRIVARPLNDSGQVLNPVYANNGNRLTSQGLASIALDRDDTFRPFWTEASAYKILRQPVTTSAAPYELPEGVAIDLEASGVVGEVPFHFFDDTSSKAFVNNVETENDQPIYIMFTPEGSVERVQMLRNGGRVTGAPVGNVSLLVGRRELIPASTTVDLTSSNQNELELEKNKLNWLNLESRWVTIGAQSGSVVTTENAFVTLSDILALDYDGDGTVDNDRLETRMGQIAVAQEFAREMRRTGGR